MTVKPFRLWWDAVPLSESAASSSNFQIVFSMWLEAVPPNYKLNLEKQSECSENS